MKYFMRLVAIGFSYRSPLYLSVRKNAHTVCAEWIPSRKATPCCGFLQTVGKTDMKQFIGVLLTLFTGLSSVWANLGDSDDRVDDSYGNLVKRHLLDDGTVSVLYHKDRYLYEVTFANGRSVLERYSHLKGTDLSEKEITRFLKANSAGAKWMADSTSKEGREFKRSDHNAEAKYASVDGRPTLTVRELQANR